MNKYQLTLENKIKNSKHSPTRNFLYYVIAPLVVLLAGIILFCTVGFNYGVDFTGGSSFTIYTNNDAIYQDVESYDLDDAEDYSIVYNKIVDVLADGNCTLVSCQTTKVDIFEDNVFGGQAIKVVYQNSATGEDAIANQNEALRSRILSNFEYQSHQNALSSIDTIEPSYTFNWLAGLLSAILFAMLACAVYFAVRFGLYAFVMTILQVAFDGLLTLSLLAICRVTVNMSVGIVILASVVLSLANIFLFLNKTRDGVKAGRYAKMRNNDMADATTKDLAVKKGIAYIIMLLVAIIFVALSVSGIRMVALGIILALVVTFYTSNFVLGSVWATIYRPKKIKKQL